jgi:subtilisin family serine protease
MAFLQQRRLPLFLIALTFLGYASSCGSPAGQAIQQIFCGRGDAKSKMTVGFNLDILNGLLGLRSAAASDEDIKGFLNSTLSSAKIDPKYFQVSAVESVIPGDAVRFLEVGGSFGEYFGQGASILKAAFASSALTSSDSALDFVSESFGVKAAAAERIYYRSKVYKIASEWLPSALYQRLSSAELEPDQDQWALNQTEYDEAVALFTRMAAVKARNLGTNPVIVAVLDTGVAKDHPDLKDILVKGYNATGEGSKEDWNDENGHGTHCAGIIAARKTTGQSPVGVATMAQVKIMPIKVLGGSGSGGFQAIEKGIRYAMDQGAEVISMSLGAGLEYEDVEKQGGLINKVLQDAIDKGIIILIAAGNEACPLGGNCTQSGGLFSKSKFEEYTVVPCAYSGSICVGATNADETLAEYSNYSSQKDADYRTQPDVNAPGTAIYSTWIDTDGPASYKTISGTSMATPYVAGIAALLKSVDPEIDQKTAMALLQKGQVYPEQIKSKSGTGRVDLLAVLNETARTRLDMDEAPYSPEERQVEAPETESGSLDAVGDLWGAVCQ